MFHDLALDFDTVILGPSLQQWLSALAVGAAIYILLNLFKRALLQRLQKLRSGQTSNAQSLLANCVAQTKQYFFVALSILVGVNFLALRVEVFGVLRSLLFIPLVIQVWFWADVALEYLVRRVARSRLHLKDSEIENSAMPAMMFVGRLFVLTVLVLMALDNFGVNVTALVTGLGIGGIAIALALQNILGDLFASMSILLDKPFVVGDFVVVGDVRGTIERIGLKTTRIRSLDGEQIVMSNNDLLASRIQNFKRMQDRRIVFRIGVTYQTPLEKLKGLGSKIEILMSGFSGVRVERVNFLSFGPSSLDYEIAWWVCSSDYKAYTDMQEKINLALIELFQREGVEFAYPTQTLFIAKESTLGA